MVVNVTCMLGKLENGEYHANPGRYIGWPDTPSHFLVSFLMQYCYSYSTDVDFVMRQQIFLYS